MTLALAVELLLLLITANGAPILAHKLFGARAGRPIDNRRCFLDGQPLLGASKTWRGVAAALVLTPLLAVVLGLSPVVGAQIACAAMLGDLLSSFLKRRLRIAPSGMALGLDQIPESLLPLLAVRAQFALSNAEIALLTVAFMLAELLLSQILYRLRIRKQPY